MTLLDDLAFLKWRKRPSEMTVAEREASHLDVMRLHVADPTRLGPRPDASAIVAPAAFVSRYEWVPKKSAPTHRAPRRRWVRRPPPEMWPGDEPPKERRR